MAFATRLTNLVTPSRVLLAAVVALTGLAAAPSAPAQAARAGKIPSSFFGTHHAGFGQSEPRGWPQAPVGTVRLWDNGVAWNQIEVAPGVFNFSRLDMLVAQARSHGAGVLLVLGQTPRFYSSNPTAPGAYGLGASAMPASKAAWQQYVTAVAWRNANLWGNAVELQVWNEANAIPYWTGTPAQMALLTQWTREALNAAGSHVRLVAPAMVTRLHDQRVYIDKFYAQKVAGKNVSSYVDALSFQLYPTKVGTPEESMTLLRTVRSILARHHVSKPIYNTEINYGLVGGPGAGAAAKRISTARQVGYVGRTFVLNAENHVSRVFWYSWDLQRMANTAMVSSNEVSLTPAGRAFVVVRSWILNTRPSGCFRARNGTYTCKFSTGSGVRRAVWNPSHTVKVRAPRTTKSYSTLDGHSHKARGGKRVKVGEVPVLFRSKR